MKNPIVKKVRNLIGILSILGPGFITVCAGNDAGGIATYSMVGAKYGYSMLWGLVLITIGLAVTQETNARMAVVTGKGLSDLIRERFGVKLTFFAMLVLFIANFGVVLGDFAGVAASMELFGISKYISVPVVAIFIWLLVTKGSYNKAEKVFLFLSLAFFSYIISAYIIRDKWSWIEVGYSIVHPTIKFETDFLLMFIGMIGTTITPYMQFYLQSSVVDKKLTIKEYKYERFDVYMGSVWGLAIAFFVIICTASALFNTGIQIESAEQAALALKPVAGQYASALFGIGLFGASVLAAAIIPLSTSYAICEAFGWESGVDNEYREAPAFYTIYTGIIAVSAILILLPGVSLLKVILATQQIAGILCPIILIFMLKLINDKRIMGEYTNKPIQNIISWITISFVMVLTAILFFKPVVLFIKSLLKSVV